MVGAGAIPFALMGYIISNYRLDKQIGAQVRLNPVLLSTILGETIEDIQAGIDYLCKPDPRSTSPAEEGRRLVQVGQFDYRVVNGAKYDAIRNAEEKRQANRLAQQRVRQRDKQAAPEPEVVEAARRQGFQKPTLEQLHARAVEKGYPKEKVEPFFNHYESNGWKVGRNPMKDWHASMAGWMARNYELQNNNKSGPRSFDRNKGTANEGHAERFSKIPAANQ